jgi:hypothetical protein
MVTSVGEQNQKRQSSIENGKRTEQRVFIVKCDSARDGTTVAVTGNDGVNRVPYYGEPHPDVPNCYASSISADTITNTSKHFLVTVKYEGSALDDVSLHPLDRPPEFAFGANEFTEAWFKDESNPPKLFTTSAGERFDTLFERDNSNLLITMTRNEAEYDVLAADSYRKTYNQDVVILNGQPYAPETLRLGPITAQQVSEVWHGLQVDYYRVTYPFKANKDTWAEKVDDAGIYYCKTEKKT